MTTSDVVTPAPAGSAAPTAAVEPAKPWALSPSRAGDFMTCPLLYRYRVIDRLPEPPSLVTTRGTLVHAVLERLFDHPAAERTIEQAVALVEPQWLELLEATPELKSLFGAAPDSGEVDEPNAVTPLAAWLASAHALLETYFRLEDPRRIEPAQREVLVETELSDGVRLRGFVDRIDVASTGATRIVDYKTGNAPSELFEDKALFQLKFYALVLWRVHGSLPALLQLMYLGDGQVLRYVPDEADLLATERKVRALWQAIERALRTGDFPARSSKLCNWCAHQALCPEFGGVQPAYPEPTVAVAPIDVPTWEGAQP